MPMPLLDISMIASGSRWSLIAVPMASRALEAGPVFAVRANTVACGPSLRSTRSWPVAATRFPLASSDVWDLPGPEALSGNEILRRVAAVMGRRPLLLRVPFVSPSLSSHWIRLVTRADYRLAAELVEGLTSDLLARRAGFWAAAGLPGPIVLEEAARRALAAERDHLPLRSLAFESIAGALTRRA